MATKHAKKNHVDRRTPLQRHFDNASLAIDQSYIDVITPEMAAKGCYKAENKGRRYYRLQHVDRLHKAGKLTYEQHQAAEWYRAQWDAGQYDRPSCADYTRVRGENVVQFTLPTNAQQARDNWRHARSVWPALMCGFMERLILRDEYPPLRQRASQRRLTDIRNSLDAMAKYLRLT